MFGTPSGGGFAPTTNSAFTTDNEPSGLNVTVQGTNVALKVTGDNSGSDVAEFIPNGGSAHSGAYIDSTGHLNLIYALTTQNGGTGANLFGAAAGTYPKANGSGAYAASTGAASGVGTCASHEWAQTLSGDAAPICTQPAYSDLSNPPQLANSFSAVSHERLNSYNATTGNFTATQPSCIDLSNAAPSCSTDTTNASNIASGTLGAARLPNPTATTLGGVESFASVAHEWVDAISTAGAPSATQPSCGDLSDAKASCSTDATNASNITSGTLAVGNGGTGSGNGAVVAMMSGATQNLSASTTYYFPICGLGTPSTTESVAGCPVPVSGTVEALHVQIGSAPPYSITFHARYNLANFSSDLSCTINTTGNTYCDATSGNQAITEGMGNTMDVSAVVGAGTGSPKQYYLTLKIIDAH